MTKEKGNENSDYSLFFFFFFNLVIKKEENVMGTMSPFLSR